MDTGLPDHATILSELNVVGCKRNSNHFYGCLFSLHLPKNATLMAAFQFLIMSHPTYMSYNGLTPPCMGADP